MLDTEKKPIGIGLVTPKPSPLQESPSNGGHCAIDWGLWRRFDGSEPMEFDTKRTVRSAI
jgi:hypothetical protein